ncbi:MAG: amino acid/amide transporter substrate-binding protein family [Frankiales bacterium]|nr:amino acid/amide transporter substrate-binding protein family [Frankiales bacterium]
MRRRSAPVVLALSALLAACGTRLPDAAFVAQGDASSANPSAESAPGEGTATASSGPTASGAPAPAASGVLASVPPGTGVAGPGGARNTASDVGVTATTITLGTISSRSNAFDPSAFVGPQYGAEAFVDDINRRGGIAGRTVRLVACDDHGDGGRNQECVHQLIDRTKVFALVSNAVFSYAGASYVQAHGVPDVGSQPIDTSYDRYSHLWDIYGEAYPRNGTVGYNGKLEGGTEVYQFFKAHFPKVPRKAGVVYYNQADSQRYGDNLIRGLQAEGYTVAAKEINFALPDYDSAVLDMKAQGVEYVYDALDSGGNQNLCASMDANGLSDQLTAKVTTTQSWTESVRTDYGDSPKCRNVIWATGNTRSYEDTQNPGVASFRAAMARRHTDGPSQLSEWALEGWAGAQWLADAMASCGALLTRHCTEAYMGRPVLYDGHGLLTQRSFRKYPHRTHYPTCINVAQWQDTAQGGQGGWVTRVPDMQRNCVDAQEILYTP